MLMIIIDEREIFLTNPHSLPARHSYVTELHGIKAYKRITYILT